MSVSAAVRAGLINEDSGTFTDPATGKTYTLAEAIAGGLLRMAPEPESPPASPEPAVTDISLDSEMAA